MIRATLLGCGAVSSLLYLGAIDVLAPIVHPEYHSYLYRAVSELFAVGAPTRGTLAPLMLLYNVLVLGFAVGVWMSAGKRSVLRWMAGALAMYGVISTLGFVATPMDVPGPEGVTERDVRHIVGTGAQGVALLAALILGGFSLGPGFRAYSFATLGICVVFSAFAGVAAGWEGSPWLGVTERVAIYAWMAWIAVLSLALLHDPSESPPPGRRDTT